MSTFKSFTTNHLVLFAFFSIIAWFMLALAISGVIAALLGRPYGDVLALAMGRLFVTIICLIVIWQLGWLDIAGITRSGDWLVWLITFGSMIYIAAISLYAFYGVVALDFSRLIRLPEAREVVIGHLLASLSEEIMFRGLVLSALSRAWGKTSMGLVMSLVLTSLLFSSLHIVQVWTGGVSLSMALLLIVQAFIISFWWGVIVLFRGSIWPTVVLHFTGNAIVALQGLSVPVITPGILAYERILFLSIPLGALAIGLLTQVRRPPAFHYVNG